MKYLLITFCFVLFCCGSRKVDKQKTKEEIKIELSETKHEKVEEFELSKKEVQTNILEYDFSVFENFNFSYEGVKPDDSIEFRKTTDGWVAKGTGKMNISKNKETNNKGRAMNQSEVNNVVKAKESENNGQKNLSANSEKEELDKKTERKGTSLFSWIGGLVLFIGVAYSTYLIYKRLKKP